MITESAPVGIDLGAILAAARRRWPTIAAGLGMGIVAAVATLLVATPRFDGDALMLIRTQTQDPASLIRGRMGALGDLMPLAGGDEEAIATELALLSSRAVLGVVVDSLRLQVEPRSPDRLPPSLIVDSVHLPRRFAPVTVELEPGANTLDEGAVWARQRADVKVYDREDAIDRLEKRLSVKRSSGDAVSVSYRSRDSVTAAAVPNMVADVYMNRRRTVDRGLNQRRLEFLAAKADSVRSDLRSSADVLAMVARQNAIGGDPEIAARALAEEAGNLEARLYEIRAAEQALDSLIVAAQSGRMDPRWLAGFPDLLRSPALNDLISQVARVETERTILLGRVPATSPQAVALAAARDSLAAQVLPIASAYRSSLQRQRLSGARDLSALKAGMARLPGHAAEYAKEQAEVTRLAAMNAGMGAQVLEARLAALAEGGDVRIIDPAVPPRRVTFPRPLPTLALGIIGGLALGLAGATLGLSLPSRRRV